MANENETASNENPESTQTKSSAAKGTWVLRILYFYVALTTGISTFLIVILLLLLGLQLAVNLSIVLSATAGILSGIGMYLGMVSLSYSKQNKH